MRDSWVRCNEALFRMVLRTYAQELQADYGEEILEVFRQQLADAVQRRGAAGVCEVWTCALSELPLTAMDAVSWEMVGALVVSMLISFLTFWSVIAGTGVAKIGVM